jgi:di/tricarboxylate transporter
MAREVLIAPQSQLANCTLKDLDFLGQYKVIVLALHRRGQVLRDKLAAVRLRFGDALLLLGPKAEINRLRDDDDFIVLEMRQDATPHRGKAPWALGIVALVVLLASFGALPIVVSALLGCVAMVLTRCLRA